MESIIQWNSYISFLYHSVTECSNKYKQGDHNFFSYPQVLNGFNWMAAVKNIFFAQPSVNAAAGYNVL